MRSWAIDPGAQNETTKRKLTSLHRTVERSQFFVVMKRSNAVYLIAFIVKL